jgi:acyl-CoA thioesterase
MFHSQFLSLALNQIAISTAREYDFINSSWLSNRLPEVCAMEQKKYLNKIRGVTNRSPFYQLLGMKVLEIRGGKCTIEMPFRKELTHPYGIVHGGAIASLANSAVAMALISLVKPNDRITTIEFKINFFAPIRQGKLTAKAKIIHRGSKTAVGDVVVIDDEGRLVSKVIATYNIQSTEKQKPIKLSLPHKRESRQ